MELNLHLNVKPILDYIDEFYEESLETVKSYTQEFRAILKESFTEILTKFFLPNEIDIQPTAEYFKTQSKQEEEQEQSNRFLFSNEIDLQPFAEHFIIQSKQEEEQEKEEDCTENKENKGKWILFVKQFTYGLEDEDLFQERKGWLFLLDKQQEEDLIDKKETLIQFKKQLTYGAEEVKKRDLLFGREASLWRFTWLKKKPRIRLKE